VSRASSTAARLARVALAALAALNSGCDGEGKETAAPPAGGRSNAVTAPTGAKPTQTASAAATAPKQAPAAPRKLCEGQSPRPAPTGAISTAAAPGAAALPASIGFGVGKWVWMNYWAAWCKPCKEEMPRLLGWQQKLRAAGVMIDLVFVSLDDDQRQLNRFLEEQPGNGVRASYWLPEGAGRAAWLTSLGLKDTPDLPVHAIVAPSGQVTCTIQGAVEDTDYPGVAAMLGAPAGPGAK
jgi:thiol-disulfide isomerase/thioredoxin